MKIPQLTVIEEAQKLARHLLGRDEIKHLINDHHRASFLLAEQALSSLKAMLEKEGTGDWEKIHKAIISVALDFDGAHKIVDEALAAESLLFLKANGADLWENAAMAAAHEVKRLNAALVEAKREVLLQTRSGIIALQSKWLKKNQVVELFELLKLIDQKLAEAQ